MTSKPDRKGTYPPGVPYYLAQRRGQKGNPNANGIHTRKDRVTKRQKDSVEAFLANPTGTDKENLGRGGYKLPAKKMPNSTVLTHSRGFLEYLNERVPDQKLAELISAGLSAEKAPAGFEDFVPDWANRFKFVELVARLKGYNTTVPPTVNVQFTNNLPRPTVVDVDSIPEADVQ